MFFLTNIFKTTTTAAAAAAAADAGTTVVAAAAAAAVATTITEVAIDMNTYTQIPFFMLLFLESLHHLQSLNLYREIYDIIYTKIQKS